MNDSEIRPASARTSRSPRSSIIAIVCAHASLVVLGLLACLPALRGELLAYIDNPVHLAELHELARGGAGWTDLAFCGFPLAVLQSPLTFGGLAALAGTGLRLEAIYTAATVAAVVAPALVFFEIARARVPLFWAVALATTLLFYRGALVGYAASLAGMFGFYLAAAALIGVLHALSRPERTWRDVPPLAAMSAFIGLTHMYVTIALVHVALVHVAWSLARGAKTARRLLLDLPALALGAISAAAYWMPNVLARTAAPGAVQPFLRVLPSLLGANVPAAPPGTSHSLLRVAYDPAFYLDWVPQLVVVGVVVWNLGAVLRSPDDLGRYGATLAALVLTLLAVQPLAPLMLLGPQGERLVYVAKLGLLAAALVAVASWEPRAIRRAPRRAWPWVALAATSLAMACLSERVVAAESKAAASGAPRDLEEVWAWLREHKAASWGRVYVGDTFGFLDQGDLSHSHVMAATAVRAGIEQVGAYYHNTPYDSPRTDEPALAEAWRAFDGAGAADRTVAVMHEVNATHVLLVDPAVAAALERDARFEPLARFGRFTVLALRGSDSRWAEVEAGSGTVSVERTAPGRIRVLADRGVERVSIKESFHRFWRADGARLSRGVGGLMELTIDDVQRTAFDLEYAPPRFPLAFTIGGIAAMTLLFGFALVSPRATPRGPRETAPEPERAAA